jgi:hypothetical protein
MSDPGLCLNEGRRWLGLGIRISNFLAEATADQN